MLELMRPNVVRGASAGVGSRKVLSRASAAIDTPIASVRDRKPGTASAHAGSCAPPTILDAGLPACRRSQRNSCASATWETTTCRLCAICFRDHASRCSALLANAIYLDTCLWFSKIIMKNGVKDGTASSRNDRLGLPSITDTVGSEPIIRRDILCPARYGTWRPRQVHI